MTITTPSWRASDRLTRWKAVTPTSSPARALTFLALALVLGVVAALSPWSSTPAQARSTVLGSITPSITAFDDDGSVTVGMKFTPTTSGSVTGVRFYKGSGNTGTHVGALYSASGQLLERATFTSESGSGWQSVVFDDAVSVKSGATYTVATFMPEGHYAVTSPYGWPDAGIDVVGVAGTYSYGGGLAFPSASYGRSNYFVDVIFQASGSAGSPQPPAPTATPTPTPTPAATPTAVPTPSTGFPDAASTGVPAGVSLATYSGPSTITKDGTVIDGKKVTNCLVIKADDVTIKNSLLQSDGCYFNVLSDNGNTGLTLTDVEIDGQGNTGSDSAVNGEGYTCLRCDVHGTSDGFKAGTDVTIKDSWIHDLAQSSSSHNDGIQSLDTTRLTITGNRILVGPEATSAVILSTHNSRDMRNVTISGNLVGGGGYTIYGGYDSSTDDRSRVSNISVTNNRFTTKVFGKSGAFGPLTSVDPPVVAYGNTWYDGPNAGRPID